MDYSQPSQALMRLSGARMMRLRCTQHQLLRIVLGCKLAFPTEINNALESVITFGFSCNG